MKKTTTSFLIYAFCLLSYGNLIAQTEFITTWKTDNSGISNSTSITIPTTGTGYSYDVDWENDGTFDDFGVIGDITHDYGTAGTYTVAIKGDFPRIYFNASGDSPKIVSIEQWGTQQWTSMEKSFFGCDVVGNALDSPDLTLVTNLSFMFSNNYGFNQDINDWNVSNVTDMSNMFSYSIFNQPLNNWNVSSVTNMSYMFSADENFIQDIGFWDVSNVTDMSNMFRDSFNFNQDIGFWNVSNVTDMSNMFVGATSFNQDIGFWDVSNVTNMSGMFADSPFNQDINGWDVSSVIDMSNMFFSTFFNQPMNNWDVSNVTNMFEMFRYSYDFNQDIGFWDVSNVTNMSGMFASSTDFNQDINGWDVSNVTDMSNMFVGATSFNQYIGSWDVSSVSNMSSMFGGVTLSLENYDNILIGWSTLDTGETQIPSGITFDGGNSTYCFSENARNELMATYGWTITDGGSGCTPYFITSWKTDNPGTSSSTSITIPTNGAGYSYDVDWENDGTFDDLGVTGNITHDYGVASIYTVAIRGGFPRIFFNNSGDRQKILSIENWGAQEWGSMEGSFYGCTNLVSNTYYLDTPDLSLVTTMTDMFRNTTAFNQDIGFWDVSNVTDMSDMFRDATVFNQDIGNWDVSNVTNMSNMFRNGTAFNQDIGGWNVSNVTNMNAMFGIATSFNQDIGSWDVSSVSNMSSLFFGVTLSLENYDNILIGWNSLDAGETQIPIGLSFSGGNSMYCNGDAARTDLATTYGWTITDGGLDCETLGIDAFENEIAFLVYPNPNSGTFNIKTDFEGSLIVINQLGQTVQTFEVNSNIENSISTNNLADGIYFIRGNTEGTQITKKIIVKK